MNDTFSTLLLGEYNRITYLVYMRILKRTLLTQKMATANCQLIYKRKHFK